MAERLVIGEEMNWGNKENPGPYTVAKYIEVGKRGTEKYRTIDIAELKSELCQLAPNFGCRGVGSDSKFDIRQKLAARKTAGTTYDNLNLPNPATKIAEKKVNTYFRARNTVFSSEFFNRFITLNDNKRRANFEAARGGSPVKAFWIDVLDYVNNTENNSGPVCVLVLQSESHEDEKMHELVLEGNINLNDFNVTTYETCGQMVKDAMKANEKVCVAMKQSGHHSDNAWDYCNKKHCTVRKGFMVPPVVAYYTSVLCRLHPAVEGLFASWLDKGLQSTSTTVPSSTPADSISTSATRKKQSDETMEELLNAYQMAVQDTLASRDMANTQRQRLIDAQVKQAEEMAIQQQWQEYDKLVDTVMKLKKKIQDGDTEEAADATIYLFNLAGCVHLLEVQFDIKEHDSIVRPFLRRKRTANGDD
jgi:hypothetical protein